MLNVFMTMDSLMKPFFLEMKLPEMEIGFPARLSITGDLAENQQLTTNLVEQILGPPSVDIIYSELRLKRYFDARGFVRRTNLQ